MVGRLAGSGLTSSPTIRWTASGSWARSSAATDWATSLRSVATATSRGRGTDTVGVVSVASNSDEPVGLTVLPPDEALLRTLPVPTAEELGIEGLTDEEWDAFEQALAAR